ncbi:MAG: glucose-6-phosphate isomerase family protein [Candidatus Pacearchaeota archaeon]
MNDILGEIKKRGKIKKTTLRDMKNFFKDRVEVKKILDKKNPLIYYVNFLSEDEISYAVTYIKSGKIGKERFMTKGHYHKKDLPEVYYLLEGKGKILLKKGKSRKEIIMRKNVFHYIPKGYAHRTVNIGEKEFSFLSIYQTDSGHDYKTIEEKGF